MSEIRPTPMQFCHEDSAEILVPPDAQARHPVQFLPAVTYICSECNMALRREDGAQIYIHDNYRLHGHAKCKNDGMRVEAFLDAGGYVRLKILPNGR